MIHNKKIILTELHALLGSGLSGNLKQVVLFGSRINGNSLGNSDYDILIVLKNKVDWRGEREISDLCYEVDLKYNIITDTHIISEAEISSLRGKQPVFTNALERGYRI
jgi:predicted nucleotidyltransferase